VRLLLDTHVWLWWMTHPERLAKHVYDVISDAQEVRLSAASVWEATIKHARGKLPLPVAITELVVASARDAGMTRLAIDDRHALAVADLPALHRDPFDRLLIAQALVEGLTLVTADEQVRAYDVPVLAV
jgi:PIN domain nuclease of toxin-antitoxin system